MTRYRLLSAAAGAVLLLAAVSFFAMQSARQTQVRGMSDGFPKPVRGAESLRMGVNAALEHYDAATLEARLSDLAQRGMTTVRQQFRWADIERAQGRYDWSVSDRIFSATHKHGLAVLAVLATTPEWARAPSGSDQFPPIDTQPPRNVADFAAFARAFAGRYDASILAYQMWDEPNLSAAWGNGLINPELYLKMLRAARDAIHSVNPRAMIVLAGLAPTVVQSNVNLAPQLYLRQLYDLGGQDAFDIAAAKPFGFDFPPGDRRVDPNVLNFSHAILMREEMVAHGDGDKAIWLTQFGWNALPDGWQGERSIWGETTEAQQARYTAEAVQRAAQEWHWAGALFIDTLQPDVPATDAHWGFALLDPAGRPRPVYDALTQSLAVARQAPRAQWFVERVDQSTYKPNPVATFSEGWRFGELGADIPQRDDAQVSFRFYGDSLALIVRRDNYRAYTFVAVDGQPANLLPVEPRGAYLIMTSPDLAPHIDTIEVANHLGPGEHIADIKVDRGWNQWSLIGWSSWSTNGEAGLGVGGLDLSLSEDWRWVAAAGIVMAVIGLAVWLPRAGWGAWVKEKWKRARPPAWQALAAGLLLWLAASLTWAQDAAIAYRNLGTPANVVISAFTSAVLFWSPVFVLSLIALIVLFVLVLLRLDLGLMLLAFFIPFYSLPQRLFERAFSMVELLTLMCLVSWAVRRLADRDWRLGIGAGLRRIRLTVLDISIVALAAVALASAGQADFKVEAFRELRVVILEPALVYLMLRSTRLGEDHIWRIVDGFVLGGVAIALIGLVNYAHGDTFAAEYGLPRIKSIFGSPNNDALYLERVLSVLLAMVMFGRRMSEHGAQNTEHRTQTGGRRCYVVARIYRRGMYVLALLPVVAALILSTSRGALVLGVPAAVVVVFLAGGGRWRWLGYAILVLGAAGVLVLVSGMASPLVVGTRFENVLDMSRGTGFFRVNLWHSAVRMWLDHPILGVGPDNFLYAYRSYYILPAAWQEPNLSHPHNIILDFATRLGGLGLLAGVGLIGAAIASLVRSLAALKRAQSGLWPLAAGVLGLLAATLAHGLVDHAFFLVDLAFAFMLACGLTSQLAHRLEKLSANQT